ncbi:ATP-binding protein [Chloroflexales bacterium ZM16-3]|nr:ATP-binding protein [Chloroflexales bacterium ZM16-3]
MISASSQIKQPLPAAIAWLVDLLRRHIDGAGEDLPPPPALPSLERIAAALGLSAFERLALLLCAGVELDSGLAALVAEAQGDPAARRPGFSLALAALPGAHWGALTPEGPLRRWRLLALEGGHGPVYSPLRIDEQILHMLSGLRQLHPRLAALAAPLAVADELAPSQLAAAERLSRRWAAPGIPSPLALLDGDDHAARALFAAACAELGARPYVIDAVLLPADSEELDELTTLWAREARLSYAALLLDCCGLDAGDPQASAAARHLVERFPGPMGALGPCPAIDRPLLRVDAPAPSASERGAIWRAALGPDAERLNGQIDRLAAQFALGPAAIRAAAAEARESDAPLDAAAWAAGGAQARPRLDSLAQRIAPAADWAALVLPEAQADTLRAIVARARSRSLVLHSWGFGAGGGRGLGLSALFAGASGTGKTLAAEVIAGELGLDLYRVDLASVVSKYVGETEKQLRRIFDAAEAGGAVLLFDEADALFGKRSEVKDSHDRYANIEVSYLLQRLEAYSGLAILTTNLRQAVDSAFLRRLSFVVSFPFPAAEQRAAIWRRAIPPHAPTAGLDYVRLARLSVSGGSIRNIALGAAFLAADAGAPLGMAHMLRAARHEFAKLDKPLPDAEVAGWAEPIANSR